MRLFYLNNTNNITFGTENSSASTVAYQCYIQWWELRRKNRNQKEAIQIKHLGCDTVLALFQSIFHVEGSVLQNMFMIMYSQVEYPSLASHCFMPPTVCLSWSPGPWIIKSLSPHPPRLAMLFSSLNFQCPFLLPLKAAHFFCLSASLPSVRRQLKPPSSSGALSLNSR